MYKEIKLKDKVIGVFKGSTPVSLTDPEYLQWKGSEAAPEEQLNSQSTSKSKKTRKKKE